MFHPALLLYALYIIYSYIFNYSFERTGFTPVFYLHLYIMLISADHIQMYLTSLYRTSWYHLPPRQVLECAFQMPDQQSYPDLDALQKIDGIARKNEAEICVLSDFFRPFGPVVPLIFLEISSLSRNWRPEACAPGYMCGIASGRQ